MRDGIPEIGDRVVVDGRPATVVVVRPLGTIDVETDTGRRLRVSGLYLPGWPTKTVRSGATK